jgi:dTMP kinase
MADEDVVVEIDPTDPVADLKAQYDELQQQKERESEARKNAERRASEEAAKRAHAEQEAQSARTEVADTRLASINEALEAAKAQSESARNEYTAALEQGDWKKAGEAQEKLADARYNLRRSEEAKTTLEAEQTAPRRAQPSGDPVEAYISRCEPNTASWLRDHMEDARVLATNSDPRRAAKLIAADNDAKSEGYEPGSKKYFEHVEQFLGMSKQQGEPKAEPKSAAAAPARKASPPVAPVQQSSGGVSGGGDVVRLSPREAAAATDGTLIWNYSDPTGQNRWKKGDPIGIQEMARRKKVMTEQGLYDKSFLEQ